MCRVTDEVEQGCGDREDERTEDCPFRAERPQTAQQCKKHKKRGELCTSSDQIRADDIVDGVDNQQTPDQKYYCFYYVTAESKHCNCGSQYEPGPDYWKKCTKTGNACPKNRRVQAKHPKSQAS